MADLLDADSVRSAVAVLDGWEGGPDAIVRTVGLRSFPAAIAVVVGASSTDVREVISLELAGPTRVVVVDRALEPAVTVETS